MLVLLGFHIVAGSLGLLSGLWAMLAPKQRGGHTLAGEGYHWAALATAASGVLLAFADLAERWLFLPLGAGMYLFAFLAYRAAKRRRPRWILIHAPCQLFSYLFLAIATLTTLWERITLGRDIPDGYAWLLPALVLYPAITYVYLRERARLRQAGSR